jgi:hypothetical protein
VPIQQIGARALDHRKIGRADMDEAGHLLARLDAEDRIGPLVIGHPLGQPVGDIAMGIGGHQQVEADGAGRHHLFPFRHLGMGGCGGNDGDHHRRPGEACFLHLDHVVGEIRFLGAGDLGKLQRQGGAAITGIDHESPWGDLAMVRNPAGELENGLDLGFRRARRAHLEGGHRAAGREIIDQGDVGRHGASVLCLSAGP